MTVHVRKKISPSCQAAVLAGVHHHSRQGASDACRPSAVHMAMPHGRRLWRRLLQGGAVVACRLSLTRQLQGAAVAARADGQLNSTSTMAGAEAVHHRRKSCNAAYQMMTCSFQLTVSGRHLLCSRASAKVNVARAIRHTTMTMAARLKEILVLSLFCRRQV